MTFIKNAVTAAADSATKAALTDSQANNVVFNGGAGDDYLFTQGNCNILIGCVGDDFILSEGNNNDIFGDVWYDISAEESSSGCNCCSCQTQSEKPSEGGNDIIYSYGDWNALVGGVGEDILVSEGDYNYFEDHEGSTTVRNYGEVCSMLLGDASHDIATIGSYTSIELGNGEHSIMIAGKNNAVKTGNGAFKLIFMGDLDLNGADVEEDDETSTEYNRIIESFTRLAEKIEVDGEYTAAERELYCKYAQFAEAIANYTPPTVSKCDCQG